MARSIDRAAGAVVRSRDKNNNGDHQMLDASRQALSPVHLLSLAVAAALLAPAAQAAFVEDSSASLTTTNIYLNRDFREGSSQNKREEWGQGFWLDIQSGYTEGTVGFGLDALGLLGVKFDSGGGRTGTCFRSKMMAALRTPSAASA